jgi:hypothetical protein
MTRRLFVGFASVMAACLVASTIVSAQAFKTEKFDIKGDGYWMMYQNAENGECVHIDFI